MMNESCCDWCSLAPCERLHNRPLAKEITGYGGFASSVGCVCVFFFCMLLSSVLWPSLFHALGRIVCAVSFAPVCYRVYTVFLGGCDFLTCRVRGDFKCLRLHATTTMANKTTDAWGEPMSSSRAHAVHGPAVQ